MAKKKPKRKKAPAEDAPMPDLDQDIASLMASMLGKLGGAKGGRATAARRTPEERSEAARKASRARWGIKSGDDAKGRKRRDAKKKGKPKADPGQVAVAVGG